MTETSVGVSAIGTSPKSNVDQTAFLLPHGGIITDDAHKHLLKFFDTVDKLSEMNVDINNDLLSVMLLHTLPASFRNFWCAIKSRDVLPAPDML